MFFTNFNLANKVCHVLESKNDELPVHNQTKVLVHNACCYIHHQKRSYIQLNIKGGRLQRSSNGICSCGFRM